MSNRRTWAVWVLFFVVIGIVAAFPATRRTVTEAYRSAASGWLAGIDLYGAGIHGYLYLPQTSLLFVPINYLPYTLGEILWRAFCVGVLASAVWRVAHFFGAGRTREVFLVMTLCVIPLAMNSARNGQMNLPLAALMAHAAVDLARARWFAAAFWLTAGLWLKPLMLVMCLLAAALYRPMRLRLTLGAAALFAFPFLLKAPGYVWSQYLSFVGKMRVAGDPSKVEPFSDIFGIFGTLGVAVPVEIQTIVRGLAAVAVLALCFAALKRWGRERGTVFVLGFAACYTLLFNPRTENNTYVLSAIPVALFAALEFVIGRRRVIGGLLVLLIALMAGSYEITRGHNYWLCPGACLVFFAYLGRNLMARRIPEEGLILSGEEKLVT